MSFHKWEKPDDFFNSKLGEVISDVVNEDKGDGYSISKRTMQRKIGEDLYELSVNDSWDWESTNKSEKWKLNGEYHRYGGWPAVDNYASHKIPEEVHLDDATKDYYIEGKYIKSDDTTFDDIVSKKPLSVQKYAGYIDDEPCF